MRIEESNLLSRGRACLISSNVLPCGEQHLVKKIVLVPVKTEIEIVEIRIPCSYVESRTNQGTIVI